MNRTILNFINNFIPHKTNVCKDSDPPCLSEAISLLIKKWQHTNFFCLIGNNIYWQCHLKLLQYQSNRFIKSFKETTLTEWLFSYKTKLPEVTGLYLFIFFNNKKTLLISPLLHSYYFVSDFFKQKAMLFNIFSQMFSDINSNLPTNLNQLTDRPFSLITYSAGDIANIIQNLKQGSWSWQ